MAVGARQARLLARFGVVVVLRLASSPVICVMATGDARALMRKSVLGSSI